MLRITNALLYTPEGRFAEGDLVIRDGVICDDCKEIRSEILDAKGCRVIPGLIDIHTHGAFGLDVMSADADSIIALSEFYAKNGVTAFMPTTMTADKEEIISAMHNVRKAAESGKTWATIAGVHVEGPYISPKRKGCHDERLICPPDDNDFLSFKRVLGEKLRLRFTVAPEIDDATDFIEFVCNNGGSVTIGHSDAGYDQCTAALSLGANCFTHLFNAMRELHHREPGCVGAALLSDAYAELICDGIHIHPEVVRLTSRIKGTDRVVLVTDSMCAAGMSDGQYVFGGENIVVSSGIARTENGTLAGSTLLLLEGLKNYMRFAGLSLEQALPAATINPSRVIGIDAEASIENGKQADLVVLDDKMNVAATICRGRVVYDTIF